MKEADSPTFVCAPMTTPEDRRPSILHGPRVPEFSETNPSRSTDGLCNAHTGGQHIIDHARHTVDGVDVNQATDAQVGTQLLEVVRQTWPLVGPRHNMEQLVVALGV